MYAWGLHLGYVARLPFSLALYPWYCSLFPSDSGSLSLVNSASLWLRWDLWCLWGGILCRIHYLPRTSLLLFFVFFSWVLDRPHGWYLSLILCVVLTILSSPTTCACLGVLHVPFLTYLFMLACCVFRACYEGYTLPSGIVILPSAALSLLLS